MEEKKRKAAIEAILFTMGDAVELNRIAEAIGEDPETTLETIRKMMKDYQKKERGIQIIELDHSFQLCTKSIMTQPGIHTKPCHRKSNQDRYQYQQEKALT